MMTSIKLISLWRAQTVPHNNYKFIGESPKAVTDSDPLLINQHYLLCGVEAAIEFLNNHLVCFLSLWPVEIYVFHGMSANILLN